MGHTGASQSKSAPHPVHHSEIRHGNRRVNWRQEAAQTEGKGAALTDKLADLSQSECSRGEDPNSFTL